MPPGYRYGMSPVITRARTSVGAGVIAIVILVLAFGNQAYVEWASRHTGSRSALDLVLGYLAWPKWFVTSGGNASRDVIAFDLRALLLMVLVAVLLGMFGANVVGWGGAFILGWFAVIVGAAVAALVTAFLTTDASLFNALQSAAGASIYGLFVGWVVGLFAAAATRTSVAATP
jgi:hypothetical protein